jgi:hypothetical protein
MRQLPYTLLDKRLRDPRHVVVSQLIDENKNSPIRNMNCGFFLSTSGLLYAGSGLGLGTDLCFLFR